MCVIAGARGRDGLRRPGRTGARPPDDVAAAARAGSTMSPTGPLAHALARAPPVEQYQAARPAGAPSPARRRSPTTRASPARNASPVLIDDGRLRPVQLRPRAQSRPRRRGIRHVAAVELVHPGGTRRAPRRAPSRPSPCSRGSRGAQQRRGAMCRAPAAVAEAAGGEDERGPSAASGTSAASRARGAQRGPRSARAGRSGADRERVARLAHDRQRRATRARRVRRRAARRTGAAARDRRPGTPPERPRSAVAPDHAARQQHRAAGPLALLVHDRREPELRARAAATRPAIPAPATARYVSANVGLCSTYSSLDAIRDPQEDRDRVRRVDDVVDSTPALGLRHWWSSTESTSTSQMVEQRPLRLARVTPVGTRRRRRHFDPRRAVGRLGGAKPQRSHAATATVWVRHEQRDVIEILARRPSPPDEPQPQPIASSSSKAAHPRGAPGAGGRSETRRASRAQRTGLPRSFGAKSVSLPRRASAPISVKLSVRSMTCIPRCSETKLAIASRSSVQSATWSSVSRVHASEVSLLAPVDRALQLLLRSSASGPRCPCCFASL